MFSFQWDHTDNEIIAAAKKIAFLMAHLSELVQPGRGTKRELLACARGLAEVSERITELAKEYGKHCTDKKIRTNLLQVRITLSKYGVVYFYNLVSTFLAVYFFLKNNYCRFARKSRLSERNSEC